MARFQPGQPRPANGGRKKGTPNKKRIPKVADYLAERDINPAQEILRLLKDDDFKNPLRIQDKINAWLDLLSYCQGKPRDDGAESTTAESDAELLEKFKDVSSEALLRLVKPPETT